jgi:peroxiredoxin
MRWLLITTMIQERETAPDFTVPGATSDGNAITQYTLSDAVSDGPVILLFYPFDFSPVCVDQLCTFRDMEWLAFTEGVDVGGFQPTAPIAIRSSSANTTSDSRF